MKITHRKCRWAFKQQGIYLFCLKWVDKGLMKETRVRSGEKRGTCGGQGAQQHPPGDLGTHPGTGHPLPISCSRFIALSILGPAYQISYWSVFNIKLLLWTSLKHLAILATHCQNELGMFIKIFSQDIDRALTCLHSTCAVLFLEAGNTWPLPSEYFDCRHFVWYHAVVFYLFIRSLSLCGFSQVIL